VEPAAQPTDADAWATRAAQQAHSGRLAEAVASYDAALALQPAQAPWWHRRGSALVGLHRFDAALASFERALRLEPGQVAILSARGVALEGLGRHEAAAASYRQALTLAPGYATAHSNLGRLLREAGNLSEAIECFRTAVSLRPDFAMAHHNLGCALYDTGELAAAIASYRRALALSSQVAEYEFSLALALLKSGQMQAGWQAFEARLRTRLTSPIDPPPGLTQWSGEHLAGRTLVLVAEGGFGDIIHFCRYGAQLNARGIRPALQVAPRLWALLRTTGYFCDFFPPGSHYAAEQHLWYPLLSLPRLLRSDAQETPRDIPYLHVDAERVARWRSRLAPITGVRIGIVWQGNADAEVGSLRGRSMSLAQLAPLAALPAVCLIALQRGPAAADLARVPFSERILDLGGELDVGADGFLDTAALIENLDLVISVDTSTAHLAGALGAPVWVALHRSSDWRWLQERSDTSWYPGMRLFRQTAAGNWESVITQMSEALAAMIATGQQARSA
jgi:tetratricopeptide (TPR) repeat protein